MAMSELDILEYQGVTGLDYYTGEPLPSSREYYKNHLEDLPKTSAFRRKHERLAAKKIRRAKSKSSPRRRRKSSSSSSRRSGKVSIRSYGSGVFRVTAVYRGVKYKYHYPSYDQAARKCKGLRRKGRQAALFLMQHGKFQRIKCR